MGQHNNVARILRNKKKKIRRGGNKNKNQELVIFSTNAAGLKSKIQSLKNELKSVSASIFNERKLVLGLLIVKVTVTVTVTMEKFGNIGVLL